MRSLVGLYAMQRPANDPLANYERTPLGDWHMPAEAERSDPWLRLLLLAPQRPVVIDLAVFIDGKPFREKREAWIDGVLTTQEPAGNNNAAAEGTNTADAPSEDSATAESETELTSEDAAPPGVAAQARQAPMMRERLTNYLAASGADVDRDEIGWLLAEWGAGPGVVVLAASQSWQRAGIAPLLAYLDQDADGSLSAAEIAQTDGLLKRADFDGNDVVEVSEIRRAIKRPLAMTGATGYSLLVPLDASTDADQLAANLKRAYGEDSKSIAKERLQELCSTEADISLRVDFAADRDEKNQKDAVSLMSLSKDLATHGDAVSATDNVIAIDLGGNYIELAAAQGPTTQSEDITASQLAVGAVIDGNPLLRLLDRNQDGRLTLRERQELSGLLSALDRDDDGQITAAEIPVPIRFAVTLGPLVHELLVNPTGAARAIAPREVPKEPEWFASMDKNSDGDLSRGEFLGTTEQFRQFDENGDGLLSIAEALKLKLGE